MRERRTLIGATLEISSFDCSGGCEVRLDVAIEESQGSR
jgi:hypothetical protein